MNSFEEDLSALTGLHLTKDSMRPLELDTLRLAEAMTRRCRAVLDLCAQSRKTGTHLGLATVETAITGKTYA